MSPHEEVTDVLSVQRGADGFVYTTINIKAFDSLETWGLVIADLIKHVGNAAGQLGMPEKDVVAMLSEVVAEEIANPTENATPVEWE